MRVFELNRSRNGLQLSGVFLATWERGGSAGVDTMSPGTSTACAVLHLTLLHPPKTLRLVLLFDMLVPLFDATSPRRVKQ